MRIAFDFRMGGSINSGIGRYSLELLKALLKSARESAGEDEYRIIYNENNIDSGDLQILQNSAQAVLVPTNIRHYSFREQLALPKLLQAQHADLVHFPSFNVPWRWREPFVVTIHDLVHHKISGHKKVRWLKFAAYKKIIANAASQARQIITVSEAAKKDIMEILAVPAEKITVIYEGTSLRRRKPEQVAAVKRKFLLERPYFLFVGTLERKKNVVALTQGFDRFLEKYRLDMDLVIVGKTDPHYPEIKFQALQIKHPQRLVFTGFVGDADLAALYQGAYAYVSASLHEGFGLPGVEAMAFGLPLLAANTPTFNEIYDRAAIYFDAGNPDDIANQMYLLVNDSRFHEQIRQNALRDSARFSWATAAEQTKQVYSRALRGRPS